MDLLLAGPLGLSLGTTPDGALLSGGVGDIGVNVAWRGEEEWSLVVLYL